MAKITLDKLRHSYMAAPGGPEDYALKELNLDWQDGGAYALLGPSGCGKSTLLNVIGCIIAKPKTKAKAVHVYVVNFIEQHSTHCDFLGRLG